MLCGLCGRDLHAFPLLIHPRYNLDVMKIVLAQLNPIVGDFAGNVAKAIESIRHARRNGADLVVLPELFTFGYPPRDLLLRQDLVEQNLAAVHEIAEACNRIAAVVGYVEKNDSGKGLPLYNAAAFCRDGRIVSRHYKALLPNYDVFDERRYFEPAHEIHPCDWTTSDGSPFKMGITICEDLWNDQQFIDQWWYEFDPIERLGRCDLDVLINISASPFWMGKQQQRLAIFSRQVRQYGFPLVYVNQVGGNDELIFDGASFVLDSQGRLVAQARAFEEDHLVVDLNRLEDKPAAPLSPQSSALSPDSSVLNPQSSVLCLNSSVLSPQPSVLITPYPDEIDSAIEALVLGTRDYVQKCGFKEVVLGLSGGIDSAVTAVIAARALGPSAVHSVAMPSRFSSDHSLNDAKTLAQNLGIDFQVIPIHEMHEVSERVMKPHFGGRTPDVTEENMQARIRGQILMALSNKFGWLLLTTGNKSELAVGYCTLYGDMCGGLAVISDVAKTTIYAVARRLNEQAGSPLIPENSLTKAPSAELKPDQTDQDSLPPYDVLDEILHRYVERLESPAQMIEAGFDQRLVLDVVRKVDLNEYKRRQAAQGLKITARAFGVGWRRPIAARFNPTPAPPQPTPNTQNLTPET